MRLVYVQVHADADRLLRAHGLWGGHARLAARKDLSATKEKEEEEEIYGSWWIPLVEDYIR